MTASDAPWFYRLLQLVFGTLLRLLTRFELQGVENVPAKGALLVAPNHIYLLDVVIVFVAVPRRMTVFAANKWRGTPGGWLMNLVANAIYVERGEIDRRALSAALGVLRSGEALGVAPEGTRSRTGGLQQGKDGLAYLASRSGAAVLPVAAWGQEQIIQSWTRLRRPRIHVRIGEPIHLPPEAARAKTVDLTAYTEDIMLVLARMLPASYRGVYAGRV